MRSCPTPFMTLPLAGRSPRISAAVSARLFFMMAPALWRVPCSALWASSSRTELGYQGIAGIRYNVNPALAFDLDYRYLGTTDPTFASVIGKYRSGYSSHNVVASLSMRFGAPPVL